MLSPFSGIQDWISLSQALFEGALWLPSGCVVAALLFMESRYHTALSCLLLTPYHVLLLLAGHSMGTGASGQHLVVDWADCVDDEPLEGCAVPANLLNNLGFFRWFCLVIHPPQKNIELQSSFEAIKRI